MIDIYEVVQKLVGNIVPVGDSSIDRERLENLKVLTELVNRLIVDINYVSIIGRARHESSMKKAGEFAYEFIKELT